MIRSSLSLLAAAVLAGCAANTKGDFLCEAQLGSPCSTIAQADGGGGSGARLVTERDEDRLSDTITQQPLGIGKGGTGAFAGMPDGGAPYQTSRYRVPEIVGRIWLAPYYDDNQILHESAYIHAVVVDAHWAER